MQASPITNAMEQSRDPDHTGKLIPKHFAHQGSISNSMFSSNHSSRAAPHLNLALGNKTPKWESAITEFDMKCASLCYDMMLGSDSIREMKPSVKLENIPSSLYVMAAWIEDG